MCEPCQWGVEVSTSDCAAFIVRSSAPRRLRQLLRVPVPARPGFQPSRQLRGLPGPRLNLGLLPSPTAPWCGEDDPPWFLGSLLCCRLRSRHRIVKTPGLTPTPVSSSAAGPRGDRGQ